MHACLRYYVSNLWYCDLSIFVVLRSIDRHCRFGNAKQEERISIGPTWHVTVVSGKQWATKEVYVNIRCKYFHQQFWSRSSSFLLQKHMPFVSDIFPAIISDSFGVTSACYRGTVRWSRKIRTTTPLINEFLGAFTHSQTASSTNVMSARPQVHLC